MKSRTEILFQNKSKPPAHSGYGIGGNMEINLLTYDFVVIRIKGQRYISLRHEIQFEPNEHIKVNEQKMCQGYWIFPLNIYIGKNDYDYDYCGVCSIFTGEKQINFKMFYVECLVNVFIIRLENNEEGMVMYATFFNKVCDSLI